MGTFLLEISVINGIENGKKNQLINITIYNAILLYHVSFNYHKTVSHNNKSNRYISYY